MTKQEIIEQINEQYTKKRAAAQARAFACLQTALQNPIFEKLYYEKKNLELDIAKQEYAKQDCASLKKAYKETEKKLQQFLKENHISAASFEPQYECSLCQDTGRANGKICSCYKQAVLKEMQKQCLGNRTLQTFENFNAQIAKTQAQQQQLEKAKQYLQSLVEKYPKLPHKIWLFTGCTGVGKTFALECTASAFLKRGVDTCFYSSFQVNEKFLKYHTTFTAEKEQFMNDLLSPSVLMIDDLGTEPLLNNVTVNYLYVLLSERTAANKLTFVSTNLSPAHILERYGERVFSRLCSTQDAKLFKFNGDDLRLQTK